MLKVFFGNSKTTIAFQGRDLSEEEESVLLDIFRRESELDISFVNSELIMQQKECEEQIEIKTEKNIEIEKENIIIKELDAHENMTLYHNGSVRSGQSIRYAGSVVIIGDINPGGEVIAEGNITIFGVLKGLVHAGCCGNKECFISAFNISPTQLRIADMITYIPKEMHKKSKMKHSFHPSIAYIEDHQIYIAPIQ